MKSIYGQISSSTILDDFISLHFLQCILGLDWAVSIDLIESGKKINRPTSFSQKSLIHLQIVHEYFSVVE